MNKSYRGSHFYDQEQNFKNYLERRNWQENANDTIEKPIIMDLIDKVEGHDILDLGCGTGAFGNKLLELGAKSYTGIEGSVKMFEASKTVLSQPNARVVHATIEEWDVPEESYHTVVSRLAFHYLSDIDEIFHKVQHALVRGGSFIFSVEHPVMTSSYGLTRPEGLNR